VPIGSHLAESQEQGVEYIEHVDGVPIRLHREDFYVQSEPFDSCFLPQYRAGYRAG